MANVFPQQFGPYTLHQLVGRGGMAEIYRATMPGIGSFEKVLAIKKILPHLVENEEYITMLTDEARLVVGLNHANIAQVYDLGRIDDSYYIAMEYVHGVDIALIIKDAQKKQRHIPYEHTAYMMSGLCMGLHVAHHATGRDGKPLEIIHRDISPHNVLISFAGDVKVIDFGVAKASSKEGQTQVGVIKGKLLYMAPEQAMAKDIDGRADLFAAGLVMYKMLTWQLPFQGENEFQIYNNILTKEIVPPKVLNPQIPEELNQICMTLLQRDVERRYQDGYAAKRDLDRALHHIAPGYTPSRLSRFIEDNFLEQVQERLRRQNASAAQQAAAKPSNRIKEPVRSGAAQMSGSGAMASSPGSMPPMPTPAPRRTNNPGFGPTPVPLDPSPVTPRGFQPPTHQTPAAGYDTSSQGPVMRTQHQNHLATGNFAQPHMDAALPAPNASQKKGVPAILIAVILLGVLFLGMGLYVFLSGGAQTKPNTSSENSLEAETKTPAAIEQQQEPAAQEEQDPPVQEEPVEAAPITFRVTTEPAGAQVLRDGIRQGGAPLNIEFGEADTLTKLTITMDGYETQEIALTPESEREVRVVLVEAKPVEQEDLPKKDKPSSTAKTSKTNDASSQPRKKQQDDGKLKLDGGGSDDADSIDLFSNTKPKKKKPLKNDKKPTAESTDKDDKKLDDVLGGW